MERDLQRAIHSGGLADEELTRRHAKHAFPTCAECGHAACGWIRLRRRCGLVIRCIESLGVEHERVGFWSERTSIRLTSSTAAICELCAAWWDDVMTC